MQEVRDICNRDTDGNKNSTGALAFNHSTKKNTRDVLILPHPILSKTPKKSLAEHTLCTVL